MSQPFEGLVEILLRGVARGDAAHVVLMHLIGASPNEAAARQALAAAGSRDDARHASGIDAVAAAWRDRPAAWSTIHDVLAVALDDEIVSSGPGGTRDATGAGTVARWRTAFDQIAARHPEAGVALYALGDPALLAAASREVVDALAAWGDLRPGAAVLDLGCGIGRLSGLMADSGASVVGVDISLGMLQEARRRHREPATLFAQVGGGDLAALSDGSFDLAVAADVFPYLVDAGEAVAAAHLAELARVLRPGGRMVLANLSYRGDEARDAAGLAAWAEAAGLRLLAPLHRPFTLWDGLVARLERAG